VAVRALLFVYNAQVIADIEALLPGPAGDGTPPS
jgi:hypothetical protein